MGSEKTQNIYTDTSWLCLFLTYLESTRTYPCNQVPTCKLLHREWKGMQYKLLIGIHAYISQNYSSLFPIYVVLVLSDM